MNCLLAASPTLTLKTYTVCTALSLFKVIIHTSLGASIHSFKDYHVVVPSNDGTTNAPVVIKEGGANSAARLWTIIGIVLCIAIFIYLSIIARRAVDEELNDEMMLAGDDDERVAFLSSAENHDLEVRGGRGMAESPFRTMRVVES
jgi:hypothetical protein